MKASQELFELIKSLSKTEKRYFKMNFSGRENAKYLILFDEIDKQKIYDERAIKEKFKNEKFVRQLTFTKNYLYNSILNSLISYNRAGSTETRLTEMVIKLRILFNKNLYPQYFKTLKKFKQKAWEYEKFYIILELLRLQRLISETRKFRTTDQKLLYNEEKEILEKISNLGEYSRLFYHSQSLKRRAGIAGKAKNIKEADRILKNELLSNSKYALSAQAKEYYYHIKQVLYSVKGNFGNQYNVCKKRLGYIENNPKPFMDDIVNVRKEALYKLIELSIEMKKEKDFKNYMEKYFITRDKDLQSDSTIISAYINFKYILHTKDWEKGAGVCKIVEENLMKYRGKLDKDMELESMFMTAKYYFYTNNHKIALERNNDILSHPVIKYRKDIYIYSNLLNLLIHYELGNTGLVEYLIDTIKKLLKSNNDLYSDELNAVNIIQKLIIMQNGNQNNQNKIIFEIEKKLHELKSNQFSKDVSYYIDLTSWIESKLEDQGKSYLREAL